MRDRADSQARVESIFTTNEEGGRTTEEILDTSVAYYRNSGKVTIFSTVEYPPCGGVGWTVLFPEPKDYLMAISIVTLLRKAGTPLGVIDILIAAMCIDRKSLLVTKDKDFKRIQG